MTPSAAALPVGEPARSVEACEGFASRMWDIGNVHSRASFLPCSNPTAATLLRTGDVTTRLDGKDAREYLAAAHGLCTAMDLEWDLARVEAVAGRVAA